MHTRLLAIMQNMTTMQNLTLNETNTMEVAMMNQTNQTGMMNQTVEVVAGSATFDYSSIMNKTATIMRNSTNINRTKGFGESMAEPIAGFIEMLGEDEEMPDSNSTLLPSNNSEIIRSTLKFWGSLYLIAFLIFCVVRKMYPKFFNIRAWVPEMKSRIAVNAEYGWIDWFWKVFSVSDDDLLETCGMDALCFLRALRFGKRLAYIGCFNGIWLIPLYVTAEESLETSYLFDPLVTSSISNLPAGSKRLLGTVIAAYITFAYSMYLIFQEFAWFAKYRHKFLAYRKPRNYAVYVSGIPEGLQSSCELYKYFDQGADVLEAHIAMNIPELESKVARREKVIQHLEHAVAMQKKTGNTKMHHTFGKRGRIEKVETVPALEKELRTLNRTIAIDVGKIVNANDPRRRMMMRQDRSSKLSDNSMKGGRKSSSLQLDIHADSDDEEDMDQELTNILRGSPEEEAMEIFDVENAGAGEALVDLADFESSYSILAGDSNLNMEGSNLEILEAIEEAETGDETFYSGATPERSTSVGRHCRGECAEVIVEDCSSESDCEVKLNQSGEDNESVIDFSGGDCDIVGNEPNALSDSTQALNYVEEGNFQDAEDVVMATSELSEQLPIHTLSFEEYKSDPLVKSTLSLETEEVQNNQYASPPHSMEMKENRLESNEDLGVAPPHDETNASQASKEKDHVVGGDVSREIEEVEEPSSMAIQKSSSIGEDYCKELMVDQDDERGVSLSLGLSSASSWGNVHEANVLGNSVFLSRLRNQATSVDFYNDASATDVMSFSTERTDSQAYISVRGDLETGSQANSERNGVLFTDSWDDQMGGDYDVSLELEPPRLDTILSSCSAQTAPDEQIESSQSLTSQTSQQAPSSPQQIESKRSAISQLSGHSSSSTVGSRRSVVVAGHSSSSTVGSRRSVGVALRGSFSPVIKPVTRAVTVGTRVASSSIVTAVNATQTVTKAVSVGTRAAGSTVVTAGSTVIKTSKAASQSVGKAAVVGTRAAGATVLQAGTAVRRGSIQAGSAVKRSSMMAGEAIIKVAQDTHVDKFLQNAGETSIKTAGAIGTHLVTSVGTVVPLFVRTQSGEPRDAGFVVFKTLFSAQMALQMLHHPRPFTMDVQEAPDPKDIFWRNVGMPHRARRTGRLLSIASTATLCVFWSIPTAAIASLTEMNSLKESLPKLGQIIERHPGFEHFLALLAPLLLLAINETLLPSALKYFATWEGHVSSGMLECSLFVKLGTFMIIQTFFVSAVSGGIFAEITNMMQNPGLVIDLLANSLPAQSSYFLQMLLTSTFLLQGMEMLRVYPLGMAFVRRFVGPKLTKKERKRTYMGINSLEEPPEFWLAETKAQLILYYMVFFVYAPIAPITSFFLLFCFALMEQGYRYQFIHNYPPSFETGGRLWIVFMQFTMFSMLIAQVTLVGLMILKESLYGTPFLAPLICCTIYFIIYVNAEVSRVTLHLPTRDCVVKDKRNEAMSYDFVRNKYLQPALSTPIVQPEFEAEYEVERETD